MACDKCREEMGLVPESEFGLELGAGEAENFELYPELFPELETEAPSASPLPNRGSKEYIAWIQRALNQALGLRLSADGIMGPQTRSAIRSFQQRNGLNPDGVVGPTTEEALRVATGARVGQGRFPSSVPTRDSHVALVQRIAGNDVPGMPGVTLQRLIEEWREQIAPEIPMAVLLAFIRFESGGNFNNATHGAGFYELGLFQTPAGSYGKCEEKSELWRQGQTWRCTYAPPGRENASDLSEWHKLCQKIGADPQKWLNPTTQVRVGLLNLKNMADKRRHNYPPLFPTVGSDWYLRMALLMPFAGGPGFTDKVLRSYGAQLAKLPEDRRWDFLREKLIPSYPKFVNNVDEKMALAGKLGYVAR